MGYDGTFDGLLTGGSLARSDFARLDQGAYVVSFAGLVGEEMSRGATVSSATLSVHTTTAGTSPLELFEPLLPLSNTSVFEDFFSGPTSATTSAVARASWDLYAPGEIKFDVTDIVQVCFMAFRTLQRAYTHNRVGLTLPRPLASSSPLPHVGTSYHPSILCCLVVLD